MKRVLIYVSTLNASGGIERVVCNLISRWYIKYELVIITKDSVGETYYEIPSTIKWKSLGIPLSLDMKNKPKRMFASGISLAKAVIQLRGAISEIGPDYIYVTTPLNSLEVFLAGKKNLTKLVISEHASAFAPNIIYQSMKQFIYPKAYCVTVPNKTDCEVYRNWGCNTVYIPHPNTFKVNNINKLNTKIALNVGRYTSDKRQELLIKCWSEIKNKDGWQLWIVGEGERKERLEKVIAETGVDKSVFLKPATRNIDKIYSQASVFLFTSRMEGFGMVLLEAMSYGIPCISFDCPSGPRDIIQNGYNGYLVENNNSNMFKRKIEIYIFLQDSIRDRLGQNAYETARRWDTCGIDKSWAEVYK